MPGGHAPSFRIPSGYMLKLGENVLFLCPGWWVGIVSRVAMSSQSRLRGLNIRSVWLPWWRYIWGLVCVAAQVEIHGSGLCGRPE
ncbi:hypothetical protein RJT34_17081 [Clitoria ternatea]|uniref:Uncharacterized protein n=1 Tax=Clitoria ternatea TaxID=43366 RepID=A0AAN9J8A0_CLITE